MKQLLIEVDDEMAAALERLVPARSRRRSEFIRFAILRALWEREERLTQEAYARQPDSAADAYFDAAVWAPENKARRKVRRPSRRKR